MSIAAKCWNKHVGRLVKGEAAKARSFLTEIENAAANEDKLSSIIDGVHTYMAALNAEIQSLEKSVGKDKKARPEVAPGKSAQQSSQEKSNGQRQETPEVLNSPEESGNTETVAPVQTPETPPQAQPVPVATAQTNKEPSYTKGQAQLYAKRMTNQGLPSEAYPHPIDSGKWSIRPVAEANIEIEAHKAATSPLNDLPEPTVAQKEAGNYAKGHIKFQGMDISIENHAGSTRSGTDANGRPWEIQMKHHYGYIKGTIGRDKDHLDVFIKPHAKTAGTAYVIDQIDPKSGRFDEHKIVFGADSEADARSVYLSNYESGWQGLGAITSMSMADFKDWLKSGNTKKPISYSEPKTVKAEQRKKPASNTLIQAIINRGGINRSIMQDVGADPKGRYQPGLFTKEGTTDLSNLADALFNEDGFHQISMTSDIGPGRELEDLVTRAVHGERIVNTGTMEAEKLAEMTAKHKAEIIGLANEYGIETKDGVRNRPLEDVEQEVKSALVFEVGVAGKAYSETRAQALNDGISEDDISKLEDSIADAYFSDIRSDKDVLMYREMANAIQEKIDAANVETGKGESAESDLSPRGNGEEGRPGLELSGQTEEEIRAEQDRVKKDDAQRFAEQQSAERKAQADAELETFSLTGSDRSADTLSAHGQESLFGSPDEVIHKADSIEPASAETPVEQITLKQKAQAAGQANDIQDFGEKIGGARKDMAKPIGSRRALARSDDRPAWERKYHTIQIADLGRGNQNAGKWQIMIEAGGPKGNVSRASSKVFDTERDAIDAIPLVAVSRNHRVYSYDTEAGKEWGIYRNITDRKRAMVKGGFSTYEDAMKAMASDPVSIIEHKFSFPERPWLDRIERIGQERRTSDVTTAMFQDTFGFRGGEFGNWNKGGDGQAVLNHAYDALLDFADALGIPPKALSMNGELAIAFGARGHGGVNSAAAHYEPGRSVFNLTKIKGAGSLAHEWWHAVDHYFAKRGGYADSSSVVAGGFKHNTDSRPDLVAAIKSVVDTMLYAEKSKTTDVDIVRKNAQNRLDSAYRDFDYRMNDLRRTLTDNQYRSKKTVATEEQLAQWDSLVAKLRNGEFGDEVYVEPSAQAVKMRGLAVGFTTGSNVQALNSIYKSITGRSFLKSDPASTGRQMKWIVEAIADNKEKVNAKAGETSTYKGRTEFYIEARKIDGYRASDYWSLPEEMGARAFESYIFDKLMGDKKRSDYLVHAVENRYYSALDMKPYPEGEERKAINSAFDKLFSTVKTRETEKGLAMFSREGYSREAVAHVAMQELAFEDEVFRYPTSSAKTLQSVMRDVFPGVKYIVESTRSDEKQESGADHRYTFLTPDTPANDGKPERRGKQFDVFVTRDKVWIDVHRFQPGDQGSRVYAAVANFAYNTRRVFTGDPAGVSADAVVARTKMMLSSALRFGTTRHLEASMEQEKGIPDEGIPPLNWRGNDVEKIRSLIHTFVMTAEKLEPSIKDYSYDFEKRTFVRNSDSKPAGILQGVGGSQLEPGNDGRGNSARTGAPRIGKDSGRAAILIQSLIRGESSKIGDGGILQAILDQSSALVKEGGLGGIFSRDGESSTGLTLEQSSRFIQDAISSWGNSPKVVVKESPSEWGISAPSDARGAYLNGTLYIASSNISSKKMLAFTIYHEGLGHYGLQGAFGSKLNSVLMRTWQVNPEVRSRTAKWISRNGDVIASQGMTDQKAKLRGIEEALSDMAGEGKIPKGLDSVLTKMIELLRSMGEWGNIIADWASAKIQKIGVADTYATLASAKRFVEEEGRSQKGGMEEAAAMSRPEIPNSIVDSALKAARRDQDYINQADLDEEINSLSQNGGVDLSSLVGKPEYYDAENEEFTEDGFKEVDRLTEQTARDNLALPSLDEISDLDYAHPWAQHSAMLKILDGMNIEHRDLGGSPTSRYIMVNGLKLRFSTHENMARDVASREGDELRKIINVAPNQYKFTEALDEVLVEGAPTPDSRELGSEALDQTRMKEQPAVRAVTGSLEEPSQFSGGAGSDSNIATEHIKGKSINDANYSRIIDSAADLVDTVTMPSSKSFGVLKGLQTQMHKARKIPEYNRVFKLALAFRNDLSRSAYRPWENATDILPAYDNLKGAVSAIAHGKKGSKDITKAGQFIFEGTMHGGGNPLAGVVYSDSKLKSMGATDEQIRLYKQAREAINSSLDEISAAVAWKHAKRFLDPSIKYVAINNPESAQSEFLGMLEIARDAAENLLGYPTPMKAVAAEKEIAATIKAVKEVFDHAERLKAAGYAPLMRFGNYTVDAFEVDPLGRVAKDAKGNPIRLSFQKFETEIEAKVGEKEMKAAFASNPNVKIVRGVQSQEPSLFKGVDPETVSLFAEQIKKIPGLDVDKAVLDQYYREAVSSRSALTRTIKRKGVSGYSEDLPRVLASFLTSNARYAASTWHLGDMQEAINDIPKEMGDVVDESKQLLEYMNSINEPGAAIRGLMFTWFLGGSIASAAVNLSQPVLMTYPYLSQFGLKSAAEEMAKAVPAASSLKPIPASMRGAFQRAQQEGIVEAQEIHHLYQEGMRPIISMLPGGEDIRARVQGMATLWGAFFGAAENFNRRLTFVAAYSMAQKSKEIQKKFGSPYEFARRAVEETQGIYSKENRPNWARGTGPFGVVGVAGFTFKQYSIQYVELLTRMWGSGKEGKIAAGLMIGLLIVASGLKGIPFSDDIKDLVDTILQSLGYLGNSEKDIRDKLSASLGERAADLVLYGLSSETPIDVQARLGLGNIIPATGVFKPSEKNKAQQLAEILGPPGGLAKSVGMTVDAAQSGKFNDAFRAFSPKMVQDLIKGWQMLSTGEYRDSYGAKVADVSKSDAAIKAIGFQPMSVAGKTRKDRLVQQDVDRVKEIESDIADAWVKGIIDKDQQSVLSARKRLSEWNKSNPETQIRISPKQIRDKVVKMRMSREQRMVKSSPKEMRGYVAQGIK